MIELFGKKSEKNLKFLGIPNKISKSIHGRNYNWGIVTIYTIRGYLGSQDILSKRVSIRRRIVVFDT